MHVAYKENYECGVMNIYDHVAVTLTFWNSFSSNIKDVSQLVDNVFVIEAIFN